MHIYIRHTPWISPSSFGIVSSLLTPAPLITFMESVLSSDISFGEEERPSDPEIPAPAEGFFVTPKDASILMPYLQEFQNADTDTRKKILGKVIGELYALRPPKAVFDKKDAMLVRIPVIPIRHTLRITYRKSGHGSITVMIALIASSLSLSGDGLLGMCSTRRTKMRSGN